MPHNTTGIVETSTIPPPPSVDGTQTLRWKSLADPTTVAPDVFALDNNLRELYTMVRLAAENQEKIMCALSRNKVKLGLGTNVRESGEAVAKASDNALAACEQVSRWVVMDERFASVEGAMLLNNVRVIFVTTAKLVSNQQLCLTKIVRGYGSSKCDSTVASTNVDAPWIQTPQYTKTKAQTDLVAKQTKRPRKRRRRDGVSDDEDLEIDDTAANMSSKAAAKDLEQWDIAILDNLRDYQAEHKNKQYNRMTKNARQNATDFFAHAKAFFEETDKDHPIAVLIAQLNETDMAQYYMTAMGRLKARESAISGQVDGDEEVVEESAKSGEMDGDEEWVEESAISGQMDGDEEWVEEVEMLEG